MYKRDGKLYHADGSEIGIITKVEAISPENERVSVNISEENFNKALEMKQEKDNQIKALRETVDKQDQTIKDLKQDIELHKQAGEALGNRYSSAQSTANKRFSALEISNDNLIEENKNLKLALKEKDSLASGS